MKKLTVVCIMAALLGVFIYLSKRKEDNKIGQTPDAGENCKENKSNLTRGQRNNNPFNIRYNAKNSWVGQTGSDGAFCVFDSMAHGIRAGGVLLRNYIKQGNNTIEKIITKFAPSSENNTSGYIASVEKMSGMNRGQVLKNTDLWRIAVPMMLIESRYEATEADQKYFVNTF